LVVNEAMAAGLAVIAHRHCGAAVDLVGPDNGILLEGFEPDELARAMREMLNDPSKRGSMKHNSMEKIKYWSIEAAVCGIIRAVEESATPDAPETTGSTSCS
jgi:glycosyltransferase involved in cell wall biosynthesis